MNVNFNTYSPLWDFLRYIFTNFTINTASFFMKRRRCGFTTLSTYRRQLPGRARTHVCLWYPHTHARPSTMSRTPYRLIDGDPRVGNPIHRAEDKFHVPQCVSKWETPVGGGARSTAVTSGNYGHRWICVCVYTCARGGASPISLSHLESCTPGWLGAGNSLQLE